MRLSSILTAAALVAVGTSAFAQVSTGSQQAGAKILTAITISTPTPDGNSTDKTVVSGNEMWFGRFITGFAQDVTLNPNSGNRVIPTGGAAYTVGGDYYMPTYTVKASTGEKFTFTTPDTIDVTFGANTMTVKNFQFSISDVTNHTGWGVATNVTSAGATTTSALNFTEANGFKLRLGATLAIPAAPVVGLYQGTYTLTVAYN